MTAPEKIVLGFLLIATQALAAPEHAELVGSEFDFGTVYQNVTLAHQVWLHAGPDDTLYLVDIKTGCGCLTAPWEETLIAPKDSLRLVFYWQTRGSDGPQALSIYFFVEPEPYPLEARLSGIVVTQSDTGASVHLKPWRVNFRDDSGGKMNEIVTLTNSSPDELTLKLAEVGPEIEVEIPDVVGAGKSVDLRVKRTDTNAGSRFETSFTVETAGNSGPKQRVSVPVVYGDFSFRPDFTTTRR